ncbi:hypothetical protein E7704_03130, partial [Campylobacter jejuni]|nr:hypothetical protein [Campylobacter jejuni]
QLSVASCFLRCDYFKDTFFDENLILNFEDGKFINIYLFKNKSYFYEIYCNKTTQKLILKEKNENHWYYRRNEF